MFGSVAIPALAAAVALGAAPAASSPAAGAGIRVPRGFEVSIYARGLKRPTALAWGPGRRLYAAEEKGRIVRLQPGSRPSAIASGFRTPLGIVFRGNTLFVSSQGRLDRLTVAARGATDRRTLLAGLPYHLHQQDGVVLGRDGRLYLGSGSTCNACRERDRRSAAVLSVRPDGSGLRVVARGMRNPFGLVFQPGTGRLYASVNGRDDVDEPGDPEPAESIVIVRSGRNFGWPGCWPSARRLRLVGACRGVTPPAAYLEPHSSADGLAFYTGTSFPRSYRGNLFVAEWGQYASHRFGRRVVRIVLGPGGKARRISVFADGFDHPLALAVDRKGALLVADWGRGVVYRIQARAKTP